MHEQVRLSVAGQGLIYLGRRGNYYNNCLPREFCPAPVYRSNIMVLQIFTIFTMDKCPNSSLADENININISVG